MTIDHIVVMLFLHLGINLIYLSCAIQSVKEKKGFASN